MDTPASTALTEATSEVLIAELKRRAVGCLIATMTIDEHGDRWHIETKGSQPMLEALAGMLEQKVFPDDDEREAVSKS